MEGRKAVTYSDRFGDRYTRLGDQTLAPKNSYQVFFFQLYFNKKRVKVAINDFTMHLNILKWLRRQNCKQKKKNNEVVKGWSERRNCLRNCFHSFIYVLDHANVLFVWFLLHYLLDLFRSLRSSHRFVAIQIFYLNTIWIYDFLKKSSMKRSVLYKFQ